MHIADVLRPFPRTRLLHDVTIGKKVRQASQSLPMKETDYREIENSVAETLRVFLESKQKLTPFERACRDSLTSVLADVVKRRIPAIQPKESVLHEG